VSEPTERTRRRAERRRALARRRAGVLASVGVIAFGVLAMVMRPV
jgi:hypothetical protein